MFPCRISRNLSEDKGCLLSLLHWILITAFVLQSVLIKYFEEMNTDFLNGQNQQQYPRCHFSYPLLTSLVLTNYKLPQLFDSFQTYLDCGILRVKNADILKDQGTLGKTFLKKQSSHFLKCLPVSEYSVTLLNSLVHKSVASQSKASCFPK